jgi:hypothetical protein
MDTEQWWNDDQHMKTKEFREKPAPIPLYPPQSHLGLNPGLCCKKPVYNCLGCGMIFPCNIFLMKYEKM